MVRVEGLEPPAFGTGNQRSIQLSYTRELKDSLRVILAALPAKAGFTLLQTKPGYYLPLNPEIDNRGNYTS
jgi:hypothetical protein